MKRLYFTFAFILFASSIKGIWAQDSTGLSHQQIRFRPLVATSPFFSPQRFHTSFTFGTGYMASKYGGGFFTSISPGVTYTLSPKFSLEAGVLFSSGFSSFNALMHVESGPAQLNRTSVFSVYASGHYMLSNKLVLTGTAFQTMNPNRSAQINPYYLDYKGGSLGLDYMLKEHVRISTTIGFSNYGHTNNPWQNEFASPHPFSGYAW
jgi:hypothetical protein